ncbi:glycoprotein [Sandjimba virus]|uniref:Glycoprotein n=1 Tax=Sandjimba virus TaxID=380432 RepID=A0AAE8XBL0_9RHAB|nr:glycoprotein [Sandjimba virus]UAU42856.1 glycoprotein [Sandjimba virus]
MFSFVFMCLLVSGYGYEHMYFPTSMTTDFKPVPIDKLNCPYDIDDTYFNESIAIPGKLLVTNTAKVPGQLCYKHRLVTQCSENFFGHQTYTHEVEHLPISSTDKIEVIENDDKAPDVTCKWMSDVVAEKIVTLCDNLEIDYDVSMEIGLHPSLGSFKCSDQVCSVDKYHLFKTSNISSIVKSYTPTLLEFEGRDGHITQDSLVKSDIFPKTSLRKACVSMESQGKQFLMKLITSNGLLIEIDQKFNVDKDSYGTWNKGIQDSHSEDDIKHFVAKKFKSDSIWGQTMFDGNGATRAKVGKWTDNHLKRFYKLLFDLRICQQNDFQRVRVPTLDYNRKMTEMYIESKLDQYQCKRKLYDIATSGKITHADLGLLAQNHEGVGPVYHIYKSDVTVGFGKYERLIWDPKGDELGYTEINGEKKRIKCPEWVKDSSDPEVRWCVNGIMNKGSTYYHPIFGGDNIDDLKKSFETVNLRLVPHISLVLKDRNSSSWVDYYKLKEYTDYRGLTQVTNWFNSLGSEIKYYLIGVSIILLSLILLLTCCRRKSQYRY